MFAGCNSSYEESDFVIIGVPFDKTSSFRAGAAEGPDFIRKASFCFEPYLMEYDISLSDIAIHDMGDLKEYEQVRDIGGDLEKVVSDVIADTKIPIVIGGEHSVSPFIVNGLKSKFDKIGVIVLDAHLDYRDEYEGLKDSHATAVRRISEIGIVRNLVVIGVRSMSKEESLSDTVYYIRTDEMDETNFYSEIVKDNPIYLSIDMDVFDPSYAPGVGNPEPFGIKPKDVKKLIKKLSSSIIGMDIVETNPKFDSGEMTSNLAARLVYEFIASKEVFSK